MTWKAPLIDRRHEPYLGDERTMLEGWLNYHRDTLLHKCSGLTAGPLKTASVAPSALTLIGLVRHMTVVERWWFRQRFAGADLPDQYDFAADPDAEFNTVATADPAADIAAFRTEIEAADAAAAGHDLNETFTLRRRDGSAHEVSLRWVYVHMIEEYARHNGHADLIRECLDGVTGD
ncbi:DinB family protein [Micromonospora sp. WMMA1363]|uniref:DinB family protein n=1 Tax=Micromonospora sp. WMMA1363 TaxID=3053985 RepID=UPI00259D3018|nr:DinB family protein [Micromonospora sp. WMMA1363]MDM4722951.1 DinB family protein [Micromonospora sp. WMMA1363]